jgi:hypothetical protein
MQELTADLFVSVDGWAQGETSPGYFGYLGPDLEAWISQELEGSARTAGSPHLRDARRSSRGRAG